MAQPASNCNGQFRAVLEHSGLGLVSADLHGRVLWSNRAFSDLIGYSEEELRGKHICEFTHPDEFKLVAASLSELLSGKRDGLCVDRRYIHRNGNILFVKVSVSPIRNSTGELQSLVGIIEDLTGRREVEAEFRKLAQAVEQSSASIVLTDTAGRIEYVNQKFTELTGYSSAEVIGKNPRVLKSGEMSAKNYEELWQTITSGKQWRGEFHNCKKNGEYFWERALISPVFDNSGKITHFLAIKEDISEQKELEVQLTETLGFNRRIVSNAPVGILVYEHTGRCILANAAAAASIGISVSELRKQNFRELDSWRRSGMLETAEATLRDKSSREGEFNFITTCGKEVWLVCHFSSIQRFQQDCLLLILDDITSTRQAEEKLREQAALLDHVPDAILLLDEENRIKFWNAGAERIYGWTAAEVLGKSPRNVFQKGVVTPELKAVIESVAEKGRWKGEMVEYTKSGKTVTVEKHNIAVRDLKGRDSVLIINTDITKRKELEAQLFRTERLESLGTLASGIAHDLNNVLTPILFSVQLLKSEMSPEEREKLLQVLEANIERGANLVKQVLTFGRGTEGKRKPFPPSEVIRDIRHMIAETFPKTIECDFSVPEDLWQILGNPTQIYQVLLNLCINARDAMSTKPAGKGTGLGLSTALGIIKGHGGFIKCYSELGKGTDFQVFFPAATRPEDAAIASAASGVPRGNNELVLLVDDEETIRDVARQTLMRFGYRVVLAADGAQALAIYAQSQNEITAVITDMDMPVMNGVTLIEELRSINPRVRIIGCSGLPIDGAEVALDRFVSKPYTPQTLLGPLKELLRSQSLK